jgi:peptidoglycan hydrolase-like protein with peptidoglycan-binding domain
MKRRRVTITAIAAFVLVLFGGVNAYAGSYGSGNANLSAMPVLGTSYTKQGNVVGFWQSVLYADGHGNQCTSNSANGIDGYFGTRTAGGTTTWQNRFIGAGAGDGIVGKNTWNRAFQSSVYMGVDDSGHADQYRYAGLNQNVRYVRNYSGGYLPENLWGFTSPSNPAVWFQPFYWPNITFYTC